MVDIPVREIQWGIAHAFAYIASLSLWYIINQFGSLHISEDHRHRLTFIQRGSMLSNERTTHFPSICLSIQSLSEIPSQSSPCV